MMANAETNLTQLRRELLKFVTSPRAQEIAERDGREAWPIVLETRVFSVDNKSFDRVEMDESFKFYVSKAAAVSATEWKIGYGGEFDVGDMCAAVREAVATALAS